MACIRRITQNLQSVRETQINATENHFTPINPKQIQKLTALASIFLKAWAPRPAGIVSKAH